MTTAAITPPGLLTEPGLDDRLRWAISDTITMTRRDLIRTARQPEMWTFAVTMGAFFLLLFYYVFGGAIGAGTGVDYIQFLVPGVLVITALNGAQQTGNSLAVDLTEGVVDRLRSLPMNQGAVLTGRTIADTMRNTLTLVVVAVLGYLLGFRFSEPRRRRRRSSPGRRPRLLVLVDQRRHRRQSAQRRDGGDALDVLALPAAVRLERLHSHRPDAGLAAGLCRQPADLGGSRCHPGAR